MAAKSSINAKTAHALNSIVLQIKAANAKLDAGCSSALCVSDLRQAHAVLRRLVKLSGSLAWCKSVKLDEAVFYMRKTRLCELLLSLLRRWPWAEMRQEREAMQTGLLLLPDVLCSVHVFLCVAARVCSSQQAAAYAEMYKRCYLGAHLRTLGC